MEELFHQKFFHPTDLEQIIQEEWIYTQLRWNEAENLTLIENGMMDDAHQGNSGFLMQSDDYIIIKPAGSHQRLPELKRVQSRNQSLAIQSAGQLVVSEVASEIVARALTRVAISMGIITTGAGSSAYTFGAGAILGLIIDQCYSWIQNPEGELEEELIQAIGLLADEVTDSYQRLLSEQLDQRMDALRQIQ